MNYHPISTAHSFIPYHDVVDEPTTTVIFAWPSKDIAPLANVLVESWDHKRYGRVRREYLKEFSDSERKQLSRIHTKARRWVLQTGTPDRVIMTITSHTLLVRAANFFATI